jgi:arabinan endo-1,5-alpha-L-arabinosidase
MFGSFWSGIQQVELNANDDNKDGNMDGLLAYTGDGQDIKNIISNTTLSPLVVEGATIYKHANVYYIFFSVGKCCEPSRESVRPGDEYHVVVCRSDSITGPFFDKDGKNCLTENGGTTILASQGDVWAPGGQGVMWDENMEKDVMYYHYGKSIFLSGRERDDGVLTLSSETQYWA